ncbi:MAG: hypothetical protein WC095_02105 [Candidatus Paceibacterota bacterium]
MKWFKKETFSTIKKTALWTLLILVILGLGGVFTFYVFGFVASMVHKAIEATNTVEKNNSMWLLIAVILTPPFLAFMFILHRKGKLKKINMSRAKKTDWKWLKTLLSFVAIHILLAIFFHEENWYKNYVWNVWIVLAQASIILIILFMRKDVTLRGKTSSQLTGWGMMALLIVLTGTVYKVWWTPKGTSTTQTQTSSRLNPSEESACSDVISPLGPVPGFNAEGKAKAEKFWLEHASKEDAEMMVSTILPRESNFNHLEADKTQELVGRENCWDRGLHQINMYWWRLETEKFPEKEVLGRKISEIDPLKEEDNYLAALYLYQNRGGLKPWDASNKKNFRIIIAPVGEWSERVLNRKGLSWSQLSDSQPVEIKTDKGSFEIKAGERYDFSEPIAWIEFKSLGDKEILYKIID